jgi:hypothetical protein
MRHETALEHRLGAIDKLIARYRAKGIQTDVALTQALLREGTAFILNAYLEDDVFSLRIDGLKKVEGRSDLGEFHYIPMLFSGSRKVHKNERLLLETLGAVLGRLQGRAPVRGVVCHGASYTTTSVSFTAGLRPFAAGKRGKRRPKGVELYPKGFEPPHWANVRWRNALRATSLSKHVLDRAE